MKNRQQRPRSWNEIKEKHLEPIRSAYNEKLAQSRKEEQEALKKAEEGGKEEIQQKYKAEREKLDAEFQKGKVEAAKTAQEEIKQERGNIHRRLFGEETADSFAQYMGKFKAFIEARLPK